MLGTLLVETRWIHFPYERTQVSALNLGDENEHTSPGKGGGGGLTSPGGTYTIYMHTCSIGTKGGCSITGTCGWVLKLLVG